jgi:hypothetical protein
VTGTPQTLPDLARTVRDTSKETVASLTRSAASTSRRHRQELLILAATIGFVVLVLLVSLPALF